MSFWKLKKHDYLSFFLLRMTYLMGRQIKYAAAKNIFAKANFKNASAFESKHFDVWRKTLRRFGSNAEAFHKIEFKIVFS